MEWWEILIIVAVAGVIVDNMVCNICRSYVYVKEKKKDGEQE